MQQPIFLRAGDKVTIISTARKISKEEIEGAKHILTAWGLNVSFGKNLFSENNQFAGSTEQRVEGLQNALDDERSKAVICARGGYGTVQLIDSIDFSAFIKIPKWLVGYSDVTVLHNHIQQNFAIESLHAIMPINFPKQKDDAATLSLKGALFGEAVRYDFIAEETTDCCLEGELVGGNLSIIYSLTGTNSQIDTNNKLLFIEDLDEYLYHIDRIMMNLGRAGVLKNCKGVLVGGMSSMNDNTIPFGKSAEQIILENCKIYNVPVVFGIPAGHIKNNLALIMGRKTRVEVVNGKGILTQDGRA